MRVIHYHILINVFLLNYPKLLASAHKKIIFMRKLVQLNKYFTQISSYSAESGIRPPRTQ